MDYFAEPPAFEVLPSLKRLKKRVRAAGRGEYNAVLMSGRYVAYHLYIMLVSSINIRVCGSTIIDSILYGCMQNPLQHWIPREFGSVKSFWLTYHGTSISS